jgi:hypothetical protein
MRIAWWIAVLLQPVCILWSMLMLAVSLPDSGRMRHKQSVSSHVRVYSMAFAPLFFLTLVAWQIRPKSPNLFWILAILPGLAGAWLAVEELRADSGQALKIAGPFVVYVLAITALAA